MKCEICGNEYDGDNYYKNEDTDEIICEECLLESDGITTSTATSYYVDGEYIGNDLDFDELINNVCSIFGYKKVKEEENG